ncbi:MAG: apolipoprotein N-acyltransferase [Nitrospirae bacterium]|nr:apolipoprotein N-acyltransferase [Nitrospirota bacterium]
MPYNLPKIFIPSLQRYFPVLLSSFLLISSFPKLNLSFLVWIALVPFLFYVLKAQNPRESFKIGLIFGVIFFYGCQYWIYHSINFYGNISFFSSLCIVFLLCFYEGLYIGIFAALLNHLHNKSKFPITLITPILWINLEYLRGILFTGFPWSMLGHTLYNSYYLIQICDITGVFGLSFLIVFSNSIITLFFYNRTINKKTNHNLYINAAIFVILIISIIVYGQNCINYYNNKIDSPINVSIIQPSIEQDKKWDPQFQKYVMNTYKNLTLSSLNEKPDLIIWPETSLPFLYGTDRELTNDFNKFQQGLNTHLLFGSVLVRQMDRENYKLSNSAILLSPAGKILYVYDKIHLVPFGEYVPLSDILFFINKIVPTIGTFQQGQRYITAQSEIGDFATLICYEIIFPDLIRKFYQQRGDFIVTITNDAWFGTTSGPYQHFIISKFRAIENRKPLIRAANTGISGFIDPTGKIIKSSTLFERTVITNKIYKNSDKTFYTKYGNIFIYISILINIVFLLWGQGGKPPCGIFKGRALK